MYGLLTPPPPPGAYICGFRYSHEYYTIELENHCQLFYIIFYIYKKKNIYIYVLYLNVVFPLCSRRF